jgi:V/A-type H+-transporting ATPase subunit D
MELMKLRRRLAIARRGHKLLKDKFDELMKRFQKLVAESVALRAEVEEMLARAYGIFALARSETSTPELEEALSFPVMTAEVDVREANMVSVVVPQLELEMEGEIDSHGLASTPALIDEALLRFREALPLMVSLAGKERSVRVLADEIERTRRRVNALEYVLIPQLEETIRYMTMKLEEFERANLTRLMKIKDMVS